MIQASKILPRLALVVMVSVASFVVMIIPQAAIADPLPNCNPWALQAVGGVGAPYPGTTLPTLSGTLNLSVDAQGNVTGDAFGVPILAGFYADSANKLTFIIHAGNLQTDPAAVQVYTGYLFGDLFAPQLTYDLTGSFEAFLPSSPFSTAPRSVFGWFAQSQGCILR